MEVLLESQAPPQSPIELTEVNYLETSGTEQVAENTGGRSIRFNNDIFDGMTRVTDESSTYYLLGYQPEKAPDGEWRKLEVKVARPGLKVRTRRGYQATPPPTLVASETQANLKAGKDAKAPKRPLDPAVMTSGAADALALRIAPYVLETGPEGLARVLVVLELDTSRLGLNRTGTRRSGAVDLTILGMSREQGKTFPLDERVRIDLEEKAAGGWMNLSRELRLPPGVAQLRVLARDVSSGLAGTVTARLEIPSLDRPYLATPIVTDRMITSGGQGPRLIPVAHRLFRAQGHLFCSYEVIGNYPAQVFASEAAVNDVDLEVIAPDRTVYLGNVITNGSSTPGGSNDLKNSTETVILNQPALGIYRVRGIVRSVNQGDRQGFSMVANGNIRPVVQRRRS
jgi:hypothetical protein